jgi:hypothetical protein
MGDGAGFFRDIAEQPEPGLIFSHLSVAVIPWQVALFVSVKNKDHFYPLHDLVRPWLYSL